MGERYHKQEAIGDASLEIPELEAEAAKERLRRIAELITNGEVEQS